jgi:hypothetical protein
MYIAILMVFLLIWREAWSGMIFAPRFGFCPGEQLLVGSIPPTVSVGLLLYGSLHDPLVPHASLLERGIKRRDQENGLVGT